MFIKDRTVLRFHSLSSFFVCLTNLLKVNVLNEHSTQRTVIKSLNVDQAAYPPHTKDVNQVFFGAVLSQERFLFEPLQEHESIYTL